MSGSCGSDEELTAAKASSARCRHRPAGDLDADGIRPRDADAALAADANAPDERGQTPLMLAANFDAMPADVVRTLLERGADPDAKTPSGDTAPASFAKRRSKHR